MIFTLKIQCNAESFGQTIESTTLEISRLLRRSSDKLRKQSIEPDGSQYEILDIVGNRVGSYELSLVARPGRSRRLREALDVDTEELGL